MQLQVVARLYLISLVSWLLTRDHNYHEWVSWYSSFCCTATQVLSSKCRHAASWPRSPIYHSKESLVFRFVHTDPQQGCTSFLSALHFNAPSDGGLWDWKKYCHTTLPLFSELFISSTTQALYLVSRIALHNTSPTLVTMPPGSCWLRPQTPPGFCPIPAVTVKAGSWNTDTEFLQEALNRPFRSLPNTKRNGNYPLPVQTGHIRRLLRCTFTFLTPNFRLMLSGMNDSHTTSLSWFQEWEGGNHCFTQNTETPCQNLKLLPECMTAQ